MSKPPMPYLTPAAAKRAFRIEALSEDPSLDGEALDMEVKRRYRVYLTKRNNYFRERMGYLR